MSTVSDSTSTTYNARKLATCRGTGSPVRRNNARCVGVRTTSCTRSAQPVEHPLCCPVSHCTHQTRPQTCTRSRQNVHSCGRPAGQGTQCIVTGRHSHRTQSQARYAPGKCPQLRPSLERHSTQALTLGSWCLSRSSLRAARMTQQTITRERRSATVPARA